MNELILLKLGGSVITDKKSEKPKIDYKNLNRLSTEIAEAYNTKKMRLILIHGAGSYGHQIVKKTGIDKGIKNKKQAIAFAETQRLQNELNVIVTKTLIGKGVPAIPCQASASAVMENGRLIKLNTETVKGFIDAGLVPVLYGVPAYDKKQKCSILSGDQIAPYLAVKLRAKKIIHGTNVDGIFTADPHKYSNAKLISEVNSQNVHQVKEWLSGSTHVDVTGGMFGKVNELLHLAEKGIKSEIVNALKPSIIKRVLLGEKNLGTVIKR